MVVAAAAKEEWQRMETNTRLSVFGETLGAQTGQAAPDPGCLHRPISPVRSLQWTGCRFFATPSLLYGGGAPLQWRVVHLHVFHVRSLRYHMLLLQ